MAIETSDWGSHGRSNCYNYCGYSIFGSCDGHHIWLLQPLCIAIVAIRVASAVVAVLAIAAAVIVVITVFIVAVKAIVGHCVRIQGHAEVEAPTGVARALLPYLSSYQNYCGFCDQMGCYSCRNYYIIRECKWYRAKLLGKMMECVRVDRVRRVW